MAKNMAGEPVIETLNPPDNDEAPKEGEKVDVEAGDSSIPDTSTGEEGDLISTLDAPGEQTEEADEKADEKVDEKEPDSKEKEAGEDSRFDKHPRFQELRTERDKNLERALAAEAKLKTTEGGEGGSQEEGKDYNDIISMEDDALREMIDDDPKGFASNLAKQIYDEVKTAVREESKAESYQEGVNKTHAKYAEDNENFVPMLNDGRIAAFIAENPGHNAISAHMQMTHQDRMKSEIEKAVEAKTKEIEKDQSVKRRVRPAGPQGGGVPTRTGSENEAILKNSKKAGGKTMAIVKKLRLDRAAKKASA